MARVALELEELSGLFCTDCAWDHKNRVFAMIGAPGGGGWVQLAPGFAVRGDMFSNIHYGYIMSYSGMSLQDAIDATNRDSAIGTVVGWLGRDVGDSHPADDVAVSIGFDLCDCPSGSGDVAAPSSSQIADALLAHQADLFETGGACVPGSSGCVPLSEWGTG
jgi:hypothetical protein